MKNMKEIRQQLIAAIDNDDEEKIGKLMVTYPMEMLEGEDYFLLGRAAYSLGQWRESEALLQAALKSELPDCYRGATASSLALLYQKLGECEKALPYYTESLRYKDFASGKLDEYSNYLFHLSYLHKEDAFMQEAVAGYTELLAHVRPLKLKKRKYKPGQKIRVGYVSPDLCRHIVAFFCYALLHDYDKHCFTVYAYTNCVEDSATAEFRNMVDGFRNVRGMSWGEIARLIKDDEIDILVDLSGHTAGNMLPVFAYKPAPIQISGIGYFATTGLKTVDYFLADVYTAPEAVDKSFCEQVVRLQHSHLCYMWHDNPPQEGALPYWRNGYITFGSMNNWSKVNDEVLGIWRQILEAVPESCLLLKCAVFDNEYACEYALRKIEQSGISRNRVSLQGFSAEYLATYCEIDIALDTFPYPGGGTTCDALYMGVPVITMAGERHHERFGVSLLSNIDMQACIAADGTDYVDKAVRLARNVAELSKIRQNLRRKLRQSPIMQSADYMLEIESLYRKLYRKWVKIDDNLLMRCIDRAYKEEKWAETVQMGTLYAVTEERRRQVAAALGRAYLNLQDEERAKRYLLFAPRDTAAKVADNDWLLGTIENKLNHHVEACQAFAKSREALKCLKAQGKQEEAKRAGEVWAQDGFEADVFTQHAVNEMAMGDIVAAVNDYRTAAEKAISFRDRCEMFSAHLMTSHNDERLLPGLWKRHREYNHLFTGIVRFQHKQRPRHTKLRIGYISPDFRQHVMFYFYYAMYVERQTHNFEVYSYYLGYGQDGFTELVKGKSDVWRVMTDIPYDEVARQIYEDEIDILVDLAGHSVRSGLPVLAYKPAPVQISGLGYMSTTGLAEVDYLLTDKNCDPPDEPLQITEKPLYLSSMFCFIGRSDVAAPQEAPVRKNGYITFGIFNRYQKITDNQLRLWKKIQEEIPNAHWYFKSSAFDNDALANLAYERLDGMGFDMRYVVFEPSSKDYMDCYHKVDIALDTYPYTGGGTTCDALYMGVPVVSLYGRTRGSRFSRSILQAAGLGELAVNNSADYVKVALSLAGDVETLNELHLKLRDILFKSQLMNVKGYMQELEKAYQEIWHHYEEQEHDGLSKDG